MQDTRIGSTPLKPAVAVDCPGRLVIVPVPIGSRQEYCPMTLGWQLFIGDF